MDMIETPSNPHLPGAPFLEPSDAPVMRCERAAAELRFGRPVLVRGTDRSLAVLALDGGTADRYERFLRSSSLGSELFLSPLRAGVLGLDAPTGALVPLADVSFEEAHRIGYGQERDRPQRWRPASALHAEGCRLSKLSLLLPALVCAEVRPGDDAFRGCAELHPGDLTAAMATAGRSFEIVARTSVPLKDIGRGEFVVFRGGLAQRDQIAIVVGEIDASRPVPVRIHSSCITGDLFGSLKCDCGDQLRRSLVSLKEMGGGVLLYLDQEGRGTGIGAKMRAYGLQNEGFDTVDADALLGFGPDERRYDAAVAMLGMLGIASVQLLTNNPAKQAFLERNGIIVASRTSVLGRVTAENRDYLQTKTLRSGHDFDLASLVADSM